MKKGIKIVSLIILFILITSARYSIFANNSIQIAKGGLLENGGEAGDKKVTIDTDITSDKFLDEYNPNNRSKETGAVGKLSSPIIKFIVTIVNKLVGVIQLIGGLLSIVSVAIFGFALVVSGNGDLAADLNLNIAGKPRGKKELLDFGRSMLIGSVLLFSSATLVRFVFNIFNLT